jgi:hypothetical protein
MGATPFVAYLSSGDGGVRFVPPAAWRFESEGGRGARWVDETAGLHWLVTLRPGCSMDLSEAHENELFAAMEPYARHLFDAAWRSRERQNDQKPRTADASWSPLVDREIVSFRGVRALRSVHRMHYEPGLEVVMGHMVFPVATGLFEIRPAAIDRATGMRESVLMVVTGQKGVQPQRVFDDPAHDAKFPQLALARCRRGLRWALDSSAIEVTAPGERRPVQGEIVLAPLDCAVTPPPRFFHDGADAEGAGFHRVSFCSSDGLQELTLRRRGRIDGDKLLEHAMKRIGAEHLGPSPADATADWQRTGNSLQVVFDGAGEIGPVRNAHRWWIDDRGDAWSLQLTGVPEIPKPALSGEVDAVFRSFRRLSSPPAPAAPKAWWKIW